MSKCKVRESTKIEFYNGGVFLNLHLTIGTKFKFSFNSNGYVIVTRNLITLKITYDEFHKMFVVV